MTVGCLTCFGTSLPLPPDPTVLSAEWFANAPAIEVALTMSQPMDDSVTPSPSSFTLTIDGGGRGIDNIFYPSPSVCVLVSAPGAQPAFEVSLQLNVEDPNFRCASLQLVQPFLLVDIPAG